MLKKALVFIGLIGLALAFWSGGGPDPLHYRLTATTDFGRFSTVRRIEFEKEYTNLDFMKIYDAEIYGEALVIEGADGRRYFGLLGEKLDPWFAWSEELEALIKDMDLADKPAKRMVIEANFIRQRTGAVEFPRHWRSTRPNSRNKAEPWPKLVTFDNLGDPMSARIVDPEDIGLRRITIEIVDADYSDTLGSTMTPEFFERWTTARKEAAAKRREWNERMGVKQRVLRQSPTDTLSRSQFYRPL